MTNISDLLYEYAARHSSPESELLSQLRRETWQKVLNPRMISGHLQGRLLAFISKLKQPDDILEIGTFTGYATLCLAEGLSENGTITTIEKNEELKGIQDKYFKKSDFSKKINVMLGSAVDIIPKLETTFDMVFIDGQKTEYKTYFDLIFPKVKNNGIILSDNVLWYGKVLNSKGESDIETHHIKVFNRYLINHKDIENILLPIRDGLSISVKK